ncbi:hypothetical protein Pcinc_023019 [Petrolisthes cinctipes]|uniref:C2H2-type domain-containing protein n=1 Tax=Petrolisthes cinctipes TaxID=88211 RepID=A0AAE1FDM1_PETCI|nr:hypothetical protein Pcinc_023019 [Petrolisthes cinctipes]
MISSGLSKCLPYDRKTGTHQEPTRRRVSVPIKTRTRRSRLDNLLQTIEDTNQQRPAPEAPAAAQPFLLQRTPPRQSPKQPSSPLPPLPRTPFSDFKGTINIQKRDCECLMSPGSHFRFFKHDISFKFKSIFASPAKEEKSDEVASVSSASRCLPYINVKKQGEASNSDVAEGKCSRTLQVDISRRKRCHDDEDSARDAKKAKRTHDNTKGRGVTIGSDMLKGGRGQTPSVTIPSSSTSPPSSSRSGRSSSRSGRSSSHSARSSSHSARSSSRSDRSSSHSARSSSRAASSSSRSVPQKTSPPPAPQKTSPPPATSCPAPQKTSPPPATSRPAPQKTSPPPTTSRPAPQKTTPPPATSRSRTIFLDENELPQRKSSKGSRNSKKAKASPSTSVGKGVSDQQTPSGTTPAPSGSTHKRNSPPVTSYTPSILQEANEVPKVKSVKGPSDLKVNSRRRDSSDRSDEAKGGRGHTSSDVTPAPSTSSQHKSSLPSPVTPAPSTSSRHKSSLPPPVTPAPSTSSQHKSSLPSPVTPAPSTSSRHKSSLPPPVTPAPSTSSQHKSSLPSPVTPAPSTSSQHKSSLPPPVTPAPSTSSRHKSSLPPPVTPAPSTSSQHKSSLPSPVTPAPSTSSRHKSSQPSPVTPAPSTSSQHKNSLPPPVTPAPSTSSRHKNSLPPPVTPAPSTSSQHKSSLPSPVTPAPSTSSRHKSSLPPPVTPAPSTSSRLKGAKPPPVTPAPSTSSRHKSSLPPPVTPAPSTSGQHKNSLPPPVTPAPSTSSRHKNSLPPPVTPAPSTSGQHKSSPPLPPPVTAVPSTSSRPKNSLPPPVTPVPSTSGKHKSSPPLISKIRFEDVKELPRVKSIVTSSDTTRDFKKTKTDVTKERRDQTPSGSMPILFDSHQSTRLPPVTPGTSGSGSFGMCTYVGESASSKDTSCRKVSVAIKYKPGKSKLDALIQTMETTKEQSSTTQTPPSFDAPPLWSLGSPSPFHETTYQPQMVPVVPPEQTRGEEASGSGPSPDSGTSTLSVSPQQWEAISSYTDSGFEEGCDSIKLMEMLHGMWDGNVIVNATTESDGSTLLQLLPCDSSDATQSAPDQFHSGGESATVKVSSQLSPNNLAGATQPAFNQLAQSDSSDDVPATNGGPAPQKTTPPPATSRSRTIFLDENELPQRKSSKGSRNSKKAKASPSTSVGKGVSDQQTPSGTTPAPSGSTHKRNSPPVTAYTPSILQEANEVPKVKSVKGPSDLKVNSRRRDSSDRSDEAKGGRGHTSSDVTPSPSASDRHKGVKSPIILAPSKSGQHKNSLPPPVTAVPSTSSQHKNSPPPPVTPAPSTSSRHKSSPPLPPPVTPAPSTSSQHKNSLPPPVTPAPSTSSRPKSSPPLISKIRFEDVKELPRVKSIVTSSDTTRDFKKTKTDVTKERRDQTPSGSMPILFDSHQSTRLPPVTPGTSGSGSFGMCTYVGESASSKDTSCRKVSVAIKYKPGKSKLDALIQTMETTKEQSSTTQTPPSFDAPPLWSLGSPSPFHETTYQPQMVPVVPPEQTRGEEASGSGPSPDSGTSTLSVSPQQWEAISSYTDSGFEEGCDSIKLMEMLHGMWDGNVIVNATTESDGSTLLQLLPCDSSDATQSAPDQFHSGGESATVKVSSQLSPNNLAGATQPAFNQLAQSDSSDDVPATNGDEVTGEAYIGHYVCEVCASVFKFPRELLVHYAKENHEPSYC